MQSVSDFIPDVVITPQQDLGLNCRRRATGDCYLSLPSAVLLENKMLAKGKEQRVFGNSSLRDKWETRAQNMADQCKQESDWKEKSDQKL